MYRIPFKLLLVLVLVIVGVMPVLSGCAQSPELEREERQGE